LSGSQCLGKIGQPVSHFLLVEEFSLGWGDFVWFKLFERVDQANGCQHLLKVGILCLKVMDIVCGYRWEMSAMSQQG
jgi:hypothetical protein